MNETLIRPRSKRRWSLDHSWCTKIRQISSNSIEARRIEIERRRILKVKSESNQLWTTHVTVDAVPLWAVHSAGQCLIMCPEWFLGVSVNLRPLNVITLRTGLFLIIFAGLTLIVGRWKGKSFDENFTMTEGDGSHFLEMHGLVYFPNRSSVPSS